MIKLEDLLSEGNADIQRIATDLLRSARQLRTPKGLSGIEVAWDTKYNGVFILFDVPREVRHPDDYDMQHPNPALERWEDFTDEVQKLIQKFEKKYKGIEFGAMGNITGPGIKRSGHPRPSRL